MLNVIPRLITNEKNGDMARAPTKEEVKTAVFSLNKDSASGPDGFA